MHHIRRQQRQVRSFLLVLSVLMLYIMHILIVPSKERVQQLELRLDAIEQRTQTLQPSVCHGPEV